jgi:hypothetical protein
MGSPDWAKARAVPQAGEINAAPMPALTLRRLMR